MAAFRKKKGGGGQDSSLSIRGRAVMVPMDDPRLVNTHHQEDPGDVVPPRNPRTEVMSWGMASRSRTLGLLEKASHQAGYPSGGNHGIQGGERRRHDGRGNGVGMGQGQAGPPNPAKIPLARIQIQIMSVPAFLPSIMKPAAKRTRMSPGISHLRILPMLPAGGRAFSSARLMGGLF